MGTIAVVTTNAELEQWLDENTWFEDSFVLALLPGPAAAASPGSVRLILGEQVGGGDSAGAERTVQDYSLTAHDIRRCSLGPELSFVAGNCCAGLELLADNAGVAFRIDVPRLLEVVCDRLAIELLELRQERVAPWLSSRELGATLAQRTVPSPAQWLSWFREAGLDVCWRVNGGEAREAPPNPLDYEGWFLQTPKGIGATQGGLFFFACRERQGSVRLQLQLWDADDPSATELWAAARKVLALLEPEEIWCGNVQFTAREWRRFLEDGSLPAQAVGASRTKSDA